jgi:hypothetical protein
MLTSLFFMISMSKLYAPCVTEYVIAENQG